MAQESDKLSPMLKQYLDIKQKYSDYILFFRLGDFYEDVLRGRRERVPGA